MSVPFARHISVIRTLRWLSRWLAVCLSVWLSVYYPSLLSIKILLIDQNLFFVFPNISKFQIVATGRRNELHFLLFDAFSSLHDILFICFFHFYTHRRWQDDNIQRYLCFSFLLLSFTSFLPLISHRSLHFLSFFPYVSLRVVLLLRLLFASIKIC